MSGDEAIRIEMVMFVIYDHPLDYPEHYVVRQWFPLATGHALPAEGYTLHATLEDARARIPKGLLRRDRWAGEDMVIAEVWWHVSLVVEIDGG
jgi:hypothetical protein